MLEKPLPGMKVAVLVETEFIAEEITAYRHRFDQLGAQVDFVSRLWGQDRLEFFSDVDSASDVPERITVGLDVEAVRVTDYAAVIMSANYVSVRLRYVDTPEGGALTADSVRQAPAVRFFAEAMGHPGIVKGALCHGLWILTPVPELLRGRKVICHAVVLADVLNAGGVYTEDPSGVVVDGDLVTGRSRHEVNAFIDTIAEQILRRAGAARSSAH